VDLTCAKHSRLTTRRASDEHPGLRGLTQVHLQPLRPWEADRPVRGCACRCRSLAGPCARRGAAPGATEHPGHDPARSRLPKHTRGEISSPSHAQSQAEAQ
jgi:hypothetical protein